jgi:COP9 signalosome complex subunit 5
MYELDVESQRTLVRANPSCAWQANPWYFTDVIIDSSPLEKMVSHAVSGGDIEVMGMMIGHIRDHAFVVTDAFPLPVEGTETRVNAHEEGYEHMFAAMHIYQENGRLDNIIGWYHSHPGYGCWLSGIDVGTQDLQQRQGPFVAVVIDPKQTLSSGNVQIGAFRTVPENPNPGRSAPTSQKIGGMSRPAGISADKQRDFGAHASRYYSLSVSSIVSAHARAVVEPYSSSSWSPITLADSMSGTGVDVNSSNLHRHCTCLANTQLMEMMRRVGQKL